ncbi:MAG: NAD-dependent deacylase [Nitrososphaerota archaeon]|nr:NAD-dependent deacylase [Nitrososphaerota archaeon]
MKDSLTAIVEILRDGHSVAFTGAGISTASGIRDYRGPQGLWKIFDPNDFTIDTFRRSPSEYWAKRIERKKAGFDILGAKPNKAHIALKELQEMQIVREIITQNTDGLHQKAGSKQVIELHGNARCCVCPKCSKKYPTSWADVYAEEHSTPPLCDGCGISLKPDVVMFGESLDPRNLELASQASMNCKSMMIIGTTASVYPASVYPRIAKRTGAKIIEINAEETELSRDIVDESWIGDCSESLPLIAERLKSMGDSVELKY